MADEVSGHQCVAMLKHDFELWLGIMGSDNEVLASICSRSSFLTVPVQQLVGICKQSGWRWAPEIGAWVQRSTCASGRRRHAKMPSNGSGDERPGGRFGAGSPPGASGSC